MKRDYTAGAWFFLFNMLDCATTLYGIEIGKLHEGNPFMAGLVSHPTLFVTIKAFFAVLITLYISPMTVRWGALFMGMVVTWNLTLILGGF